VSVSDEDEFVRLEVGEHVVPPLLACSLGFAEIISTNNFVSGDDGGEDGGG